MNYEPPAGREKKILSRDDFLKWVPIFSINNIVNLLEGGSLISCSASIRSRGPGSFATEINYPNSEESL